MKWIEKTAKTVEEAVELALEELDVKKEDVQVEVLEKPSKGFLGFIGSRLAKVKVTVEENDGEKEKDEAYRFLRSILNAMDVKAEIKLRCEERRIFINLLGPRMGIIIGRRGQTLDALQYLVNLAVNKGKGRDDYYRIIIDTEDYRKKREETLKRLAKRLADRALRNNRRVELEPMNPYERRIIHSALQGHPGIFTYSEGEEPYRKVVIACK